MDFRLRNKRGHTLECSFYQHHNCDKTKPCVVYLHANGCCRIESLQYLDMVLANPINFFSFDFAGCGKSEGTYSSVGWFEQDDLECVVEYLRNTGKVNKIALWGRSMGAITSMFYSYRDPMISAIILDSAFSDFE